MKFKNHIKYTFITLFFFLPWCIVLFAGQSPAQDSQCTIDIHELRPIFDKSRADVKTVEGPSINEIEKSLVEKIVFGNDIRATYVAGGCVHYGFILTYTLENFNMSSAQKAQVISKAEELLLATPFTQEFAGHNSGLSVLLNGLNKARENQPLQAIDGSFEIPCGDASCEVSVSKQEQLEISYSFPL